MPNNFIIEQEDITLLRQANKQLFTKLELLNHNFKIIYTIEGNLLSDSFSIDAESDIRRTYNCDLHISDNSMLTGPDKKIWIDKYIRPYIGILNQRTQKIKWYLKGTYIFNDSNYSYDATSRTLSLSCSDLMCTLNGDRGGYIEGLSNTIPEGSGIRSSIIGIIEDAGIKKYNITDIGEEVPYDLEYSTGTTYYEILSELMELYPGYEMFFDLDGTFVVQKIPTTKGEDSVLDESIFSPLVISEESSNSFNEVYNYTQVWGAAIETDYYTQVSSSSNSITYTATIDEVTEYENYGKYGVRIPVTNLNDPTLNINSLGAKAIVEDDKSIQADRMNSGTDYVFKYRKVTDDFLLLGQYQAYGEYKNEDTDCYLSTKNLGYEIKQVLSFDNLNTDSLCQQRAKYETWLATRMKDTITLETVSIPFLDVNWKITYTSYLTGKSEDYIIKSISGSESDFTMNITMIKYSELYPDIILDT